MLELIIGGVVLSLLFVPKTTRRLITRGIRSKITTKAALAFPEQAIEARIAELSSFATRAYSEAMRIERTAEKVDNDAVKAKLMLTSATLKSRAEDAKNEAKQVSQDAVQLKQQLEAHRLLEEVGDLGGFTSQKSELGEALRALEARVEAKNWLLEGSVDTDALLNSNAETKQLTANT